ncbi:GrpE-domain-containing protein [Thelephora ganbajun]|uniref:GrpE-domain-containing protein n=1 Tax=Thelephora ganbajun TaxID=370292 RepID=A0ACB6ZTL4_THEGA|nr:GrpE-domain-containing protein [Thelephora ganbajun]
MNSTRNLIRSCSGSLTVQHLARRTVVNSPCTQFLAVGSRRFYSEDAKPSEQGGEGESTDAGPSEDGSEFSKQLAAKEEELANLKSRLRYLQADFINLQRNSAREKEQTKDYAITKFASDLLETADVLSLALKSVPPEALKPPSPPISTSTPEGKSAHAYLTELHTGVEMTHRLLLQTLFKYHVKPYDPIGEKFDPNKHEAMFQAPIPDKEPGTVFDCQKIGYTIKDRVLRAAKVGVVQDR